MSRIAEIEQGIRDLCDEYRSDENRLLVPRRGEFSNPLIKVYVRVGRRVWLPATYGPMLQLAKIDVYDERKGIKNELFDFLESLGTAEPWIEGVYVESVSNEKMLPGLRRRGYAVKPGADPCGNGYSADWFKLTPTIETP